MDSTLCTGKKIDEKEKRKMLQDLTRPFPTAILKD
jgi:hypothetical protein